LNVEATKIYQIAQSVNLSYLVASQPQMSQICQCVQVFDCLIIGNPVR
jgi:hypothetical protein